MDFFLFAEIPHDNYFRDFFRCSLCILQKEYVEKQK